jgi:hypothetical protein
MLSFAIPALAWIMLTLLIAAACLAASDGDRVLAEAPEEPREPSRVIAHARRLPCEAASASPARDGVLGRLLSRAACRRASLPTLRRSHVGAARRGAVTIPPVICPAHSNRWGHVRGGERARSPLAPMYTLTRACACGRAGRH